MGLMIRLNYYLSIVAAEGVKRCCKAWRGLITAISKKIAALN
jgi:hypothetical protein